MLKRVNILKMSLKFIDIGANLTDPMFRGVYNGQQKHQDDFGTVLERAWQSGMDKMILTVSTLKEADEALLIANGDERLFVTIGCHPTRCREFLKEPEQYYAGLSAKINENSAKVVAIGECGLDYDRLHFCEAETQRTYFEKQLSLAAEHRLPLFLHSRNAADDFMAILERNRDKIVACGGGVVHSFTGTAAEAEAILAFGCNLYIGLNGCSLKTEENLAVVRMIPNDRIMLETDCPWCGIRPTHAGHKHVITKFPVTKKKDKWTAEKMIDGRNEPCTIRQVLEVIAAVKGQNLEELAAIYHDNTLKLFFKGSKQ